MLERLIGDLAFSARAFFPVGPNDPAAAAGFLTGGFTEGRIDTTSRVEAGSLEAFSGRMTSVVKRAFIAAGLRRQGFTGGVTFKLLGAFLDCGRLTFFFIDFIELAFGVVVTPPLTSHKLTRRGISRIHLRRNPPEVGSNPA
jgi:hypothetical protein